MTLGQAMAAKKTVRDARSASQRLGVGMNTRIESVTDTLTLEQQAILDRMMAHTHSQTLAHKE